MRWSESLLFLGLGSISYLFSEVVSSPFADEVQRNIRRAVHAGPAALKMALLDEELQKKRDRSSPDSFYTNTYVHYSQFHLLPMFIPLFFNSYQRPLSSPEFVPRYFEQPIDHDQPSFGKFQQRYWVNPRYYRPGGPVIVQDGGETSGETRLPNLDTGIIDILANATSGIGIVLEHRYYGKFGIDLNRYLRVAYCPLGTSLPFSNFTTDSLRYVLRHTTFAWVYGVNSVSLAF